SQGSAEPLQASPAVYLAGWSKPNGTRALSTWSSANRPAPPHAARHDYNLSNRVPGSHVHAAPLKLPHRIPGFTTKRLLPLPNRIGNSPKTEAHTRCLRAAGMVVSKARRGAHQHREPGSTNFHAGASYRGRFER